MTNQHSITPPPELVQQWASDSPIQANDENWAYELYIATLAARWGADQELEACVEWVVGTIPSWAPHTFGEQLRAARRPKPLSLKEQAFEALAAIEGDFNTVGDRADTIRRALEQLDD